jgi:hypothetical protein
MANITIDVIGNSSGGGQASQQPQQSPQVQQGTPQQSQTSANTNMSEADNQRLVADIRREMQQRGVIFVPGSNNVNQIITQYTQNLQQSGTQQIHENTIPLRNEAYSRYKEGQKSIREKYEKLRRGYDPDDPWDYKELERLDEQESKEQKELRRKYKSELSDIDTKEQEEKEKYNNDVIAKMQQVIEILKADSVSNPDNPNSYIGKLRQEQRELIQERDKATTREEAIDASKRLSVVNEKLREATGASDGNKFFRDPALQTSQGLQDLFNNLEGGGSIGGAISGLGSVAVGLSGASMSTAMKALGWIGVIAGAANSLWKSNELYGQSANLASYRATTGGLSGRAAMLDLNAFITSDRSIASLDSGGLTGVSYTDLGFDRSSFIQEASNRVRARGISDDWYGQTLRQVALESSLGLNEGALREGSRYDRYGINVTDAITKMVWMLNGIEGSGVSKNDFTRVQEKYDIQQSIMNSYLRRADKPNYDVANANLAAFSAVRGITQDSRLGEDYAIMQNAIQNPMNDKMRAMIFNTVQNIPGLEYTRGRPDLIERAIIDPANEGKIMQAVVQNIKQMYGGTDTMMGFYAFKSIFPNISPDRLDAYVEALSNGESLPSQILKTGAGGFVNPDGTSVTQNLKELQDFYVRDSKGYYNEMLGITRGMRNNLRGFLDFITGNRNFGGGSNGVREAGGE